MLQINSNQIKILKKRAVGCRRLLTSIKVKRSSLDVAVVMVLPILKSPSIFYVSCTVILCYPLFPWGPPCLGLHGFSGHSAAPCLPAFVPSWWDIFSLPLDWAPCSNTASHLQTAPQSAAWLCCDGFMLGTSRAFAPKPKTQCFSSLDEPSSPSLSSQGRFSSTFIHILLHICSAFNRKLRKWRLIQ